MTVVKQVLVTHVCQLNCVLFSLVCTYGSKLKKEGKKRLFLLLAGVVQVIYKLLVTSECMMG
jgi:hypothetical protein